MATRGAVAIGLSLCLVACVGSATVAAVDLDGDGIRTVREIQLGSETFDPDSDGDGLQDGPEVKTHGSDTLAVDTDRDGLTDGREVRIGTDPTSAHSDNDSLPDGTEVLNFGTDPTAVPPDLAPLRGSHGARPNGTKPTDVDGDGLNDSAELALGTDPESVDTDGDLLEDGLEFHLLDSSPLAADTDNDGLSDTREYRLDTGIDDPDTDGDGLSDGAEVHGQGSGPRTPDTDGDGILDGREVRIGTGTTEADTDEDGLGDNRELEIGTDPTVADTDEDGLPDGAEVNRQDLLPGADPLRKDVYVEIDWMEGSRPPAGPLERVRKHFRQAPVSNPDGSSGITLHLVRSEEVPLVSPLAMTAGNGSTTRLETYQNRYFDRRDAGYRYVLFVDDLSPPGSRISGTAILGEPVAAVERDTDPDRMGSTFMHELGHTLGLRGFRGIDSTTLSMAAYPSVMNYNAPPVFYGYSEGTGVKDHDDWKQINQSLPTTVSTRRFASDGSSRPD